MGLEYSGEGVGGMGSESARGWTVNLQIKINFLSDKILIKVLIRVCLTGGAGGGWEGSWAGKLSPRTMSRQGSSPPLSTPTEPNLWISDWSVLDPRSKSDSVK